MPLTGWFAPLKSGCSARTLADLGRHTLAATHSSQAALVTSVLSSQNAASVTVCAGCSSPSPPESVPMVKEPAGTRSMSAGAGSGEGVGAVAGADAGAGAGAGAG